MKSQFEAVKALLSAVPNLTIYKADDLPLSKIGRPKIYVVVYDQTPLHRDVRLDAQRGTLGWTYALLHVGSTTNEVRWAIQKTNDALSRVHPAVADHKSTPLKCISSSQLVQDPDVTQPTLWSATAVWRFATTRIV